MMSEFLKVNGGDLIPLQNVKRIRNVSEEDRESLSKLGAHVDAGKYQSRLDYADGRRSFATEAIDDFTEQGIAFVQIDDGAYVPANNILSARDLSADERKEFEARTGRPLREDFRARVDTRAGTVLATIDAAKVMHRMAHPEIAV